MHAAAIRDGERSGEALRSQVGDNLAEQQCDLRPRQRRRAAAGLCAKRVVTETDLRLAGGNTALFENGGEMLSRILVLRAQVQLERDAGFGMDAIEGARDRLARTIQSVAIGADGAGENEIETGGAIFEIAQRLLIGGTRVGMVDTLDYLPWHGRSAGDRLRACRARIERLDPKAVIALAHQPLIEGSTLQSGLDERAPLGRIGGREFGGQRDFLGRVDAGARREAFRRLLGSVLCRVLGHAPKCHASAAPHNLRDAAVAIFIGQILLLRSGRRVDGRTAIFIATWADPERLADFICLSLVPPVPDWSGLAPFWLGGFAFMSGLVSSFGAAPVVSEGD